jgi:RNA polymerase sigma-70 factor (ECF subfamily)
MFWKAKTSRAAAEFLHGKRPALRLFPAFAGFAFGFEHGQGLSPFPGLGLALASIRPSGSRPGVSRPGARPNEEADDDSGPESMDLAQPSVEDGVPEDMATLVLDNPVLGAGKASLPDSRLDSGAGSLAGLDPVGDAAIMLRVAAGDESSFNYLVEKYHRAMIHFLFRMVRNQAIAEELAQEVFLRVYRSRESYRAEAKFTTWLYRIATNLAVNHARDTKHERSARTLYLDAPDEETGTTPDVADDEPSVEQRLMRDERMAAIRTHVMALPERQRMAVLMHKYQGMDYRQIGDVLKLSESATKSLLFRAYQTLRDKLKDFV